MDLSLHDTVGIRLVGATAAQVAAVRTDTGLPEGRGTDAPDIEIRYVDRLPVRAPMRLLGLRYAFCDDGFVVRPGGRAGDGGEGARTLVPLADAGSPIIMVCERGVRAVPLLLDMVHLAALGGDLLPLHAGAVSRDGSGTVVTGWSKGGKTELVASLVRRGASFVADEWTYLPRDGRTALGSAHPVRLWDWQLRQMPEVLDGLGRSRRARLAVGRSVLAASDRVSSRAGGSAPAKVLRALRPVVDDQAGGVYVDPAALGGPVLNSTSFDTLLLAESRTGPETTVAPIDPQEVAARMAASLELERSDLLAAWTTYRFAFPGATNPRLEGAGERERALLSAAFEGKPAYLVSHPYPVDLDRLARAVEAVL